MGVERVGSGSPDLGDSSSNVPSAVGGEQAKVLTFAYGDVLSAPFIRVSVNQTQSGPDNNNLYAITGSNGNVNAGNVMGVSDMLSGSSGRLQKCSLGDIIFLVMLILIKSTAEQRESRAELLMDKKQVAVAVANNAYVLKLNAAEKTYKAEEKAANMQISMGIVQIAVGVVSACLAGFSAFATAVGSMTTTLSRILAVITLVVGIVSNIATIVRGIVLMSIAEDRRDAGYADSQADAVRQFFSVHMKQLQSAQEAYSSTQRQVDSIMKTISDVLQQKQDTRMGIIRDI
jgi:hypothetical protein